MTLNGIYIQDYNLGGALLDSEGNVNLIDFDSYEKKIITKKLKVGLVKKIRHANKISEDECYSKELLEFLEEQYKEVEACLLNNK